MEVRVAAATRVLPRPLEHSHERACARGSTRLGWCRSPPLALVDGVWTGVNSSSRHQRLSCALGTRTSRIRPCSASGSPALREAHRKNPKNAYNQTNYMSYYYQDLAIDLESGTAGPGPQLQGRRRYTCKAHCGRAHDIRPQRRARLPLNTKKKSGCRHANQHHPRALRVPTRRLSAYACTCKLMCVEA